MRGDRKRAAEPEHVDGVRGAEQRDGAREILFAHAVLQALERDHAFGGKARQHRARRVGVAEAAVAPQPGDALLVARRDAGHEPRAEHLLHLGEAAIAERAGEPHDGRGLHLGPLRHLRDGAERHVGRMVERELGDHLQPIGEARMLPRDLARAGPRRCRAAAFRALVVMLAACAHCRECAV